MYVKRTLEKAIKRASNFFPVVFITGPRQVGKTTVFQNCEPNRKGYQTNHTDFQWTDVYQFYTGAGSPYFPGTKLFQHRRGDRCQWNDSKVMAVYSSNFRTCLSDAAILGRRGLMSCSNPSAAW